MVFCLLVVIVSLGVCVLYGAEDFKSAVGNTQMCADVLRVYSGLIACVLWTDLCCSAAA